MNPFFLGSFVLAAAVFSVYSSTLSHVEFLSDDKVVIEQNEFIHSFSNLPKIFSREYLTQLKEIEYIGKSDYGSGEQTYRPFTTLSYFFLYHFFGAHTLGYRVAAILLQAINACLLFAVGSVIGLRRSAAFLAALFFAIHPAYAEIVNVISFNEGPLALLLLLSAFYIQARHPDPIRSLVLAPLLYGLACFTIESAIVFPVAVYFYRRFLDRSPVDVFRARLEMVSYAIVAAVFFMIYFGGFKLLDWQGPTYAFGTLWTIPKAFTEYLVWVFIPLAGRSSFFMDPSFIAHSAAESSVWLSMAALSLLVLLGWRCCRRNPLISFGIAWFLLFLLPVGGISRSLMAGRHLYIPSVGIFLALAFFVTQPIEARWKKYFRTLLTALFLFAEGFGTVLSNLDWKSNMVYFSVQVEKNPQNGLAHLALANVHVWHKDYIGALAEYRIAASLSPNWPVAQDALCTTFAFAGYPEAGIQFCQKAILLDPGSAGHVANLAMVYAMAGQQEESERFFRSALELDPHRADAWDGLGVLFARRGDPGSAIHAFQSALEIRPDYKSALRHLRELEERGGFSQSAVTRNP